MHRERADGVGVKNRRLLLAASGVVLGVAGAVLALAWTPGAAAIGALGAGLAAAAALVIDRGAPAEVPAVVAVEEEEPPEPLDVVAVPAPDATTGATAVPIASSAATSTAPMLIDAETGLFSQEYFDVAIDARIAAARRHLRPVGVVMLEVVEGLRAGRIHVADPKRVAEAISETLREADTACHRADGRFALLLEDTPENGAIWTVERIRRYLAERDGSLTLWAGVACYPAHGFTSDVLVKLASSALDAAREWRQDRIEVAVGE
jgi:GGDEF domain-containing protein